MTVDHRSSEPLGRTCLGGSAVPGSGAGEPLQGTGARWLPSFRRSARWFFGSAGPRGVDAGPKRSVSLRHTDADQSSRVREAEADPAGGPDGDPVGGEERRAVGLHLGVPADGGDDPLGGQPDGRGSRPEHPRAGRVEGDGRSEDRLDEQALDLLGGPAVPVVRVMGAGSKSQPRYEWG